MATRARLEQALINADAAGDVEAAKAFAAAIRNGEYDDAENIATVGSSTNKQLLDDVPAPSSPAEFTAQQNAIKQPTYLDRVMDTGSQVGSFLGGLPKNALDTGIAIVQHPTAALQAAGSVLSAGTTGLFGQAAGFAHGIATGKSGDALAEEQASTGNNLTYTPSDPNAQKYVENIGKVLEPLAGLVPATAELGVINQFLKPAIKQAANVAKNEYELIRPTKNEYKTGKISEQTYRGFNAKSETKQDAGTGLGGFSEKANGGQADSLNADTANIANDFTRPLSAKDTASRVAQIQPDQHLIDAASKLDILDQTPATILTSNSAAKEMIGQLNAAGGNAVSEAHITFNKVLKDKANELIKEANGDLDSASLNSNLHDEMSSAHELIGAQVSRAYDAIDKNITKGGVVDASPMLREINTSAKDLENGVKDLSPVEQKVYSALSGNPTYANVDILRKDIGHSLGTMNSTWGNTDKAILKKLYSGLSTLQEKSALSLSENPNIGKMWAEAKDLDKKKYALQDSMDFIFGREKGDSIVPKMDSALSLMANKSNPKAFNALIQSIPEDHRGAVVATSLRNIMTGTIRGDETANIGKFNTWYGNLERSPTLKKQLESHLPEGVPEKLQAYSKLTRSFANNTAVPRTGIVKDIFKTAPNTVIDRLYGAIEGSGTAGTIAAKAGQYILKKSEPKAAVADNLLSSPEFKTAMLDYEKNKNKNTKIQRNFQKSTLASKYLRVANQPEIARVGLMSYLMQQDENMQKNIK